MSLNIEKKILLPNCCESICRASRSFWISWRISIDVNPGTYSTRTQVDLHRFQTTLCNRCFVGSLWVDFSTSPSLLNDYVFPTHKTESEWMCTFAFVYLITCSWHKIDLIRGRTVISSSKSRTIAPRSIGEQYRTTSWAPWSRCSCPQPDSHCNSVQDELILSSILKFSIPRSIHQTSHQVHWT